MRVKAKVNCFPDGNYRAAGEEFEYEGPKNEYLAPVKAPRPERQEPRLEPEPEA